MSEQEEGTAKDCHPPAHLAQSGYSQVHVLYGYVWRYIYGYVWIYIYMYVHTHTFIGVHVCISLY